MGKKCPLQEFVGTPAENFFVAGTGTGSQHPTGISPLPSLVDTTDAAAAHGDVSQATATQAGKKIAEIDRQCVLLLFYSGTGQRD